MRVDQRHFRILPGEGFESAFAVDAFGRWVRFGLFFGEAPGSHMIGKHLTAWRTRVDDMRGINVRFGWWPKPCVTVLVHTRPSRDIAAFFRRRNGDSR
jgi:hypothetical protein